MWRLSWTAPLLALLLPPRVPLLALLAAWTNHQMASPCRGGQTRTGGARLRSCSHLTAPLTRRSQTAPAQGHSAGNARSVGMLMHVPCSIELVHVPCQVQQALACSFGAGPSIKVRVSWAHVSHGVRRNLGLWAALATQQEV